MESDKVIEQRMLPEEGFDPTTRDAAQGELDIIVLGTAATPRLAWGKGLHVFCGCRSGTPAVRLLDGACMTCRHCGTLIAHTLGQVVAANWVDD